jgi:outer membrane protein assembly factor BamB
MAALGISMFVVMSMTVAWLQPSVSAGSALWNFKSEREMKWHRLTNLGTVLAGTDEALFSIDPETGKVVWTRDDLKKIPDYDIEEIADTPLLLVGANSGKNKTRLYALDILTGKSVWETEQLKGATVGLLPVYEKNMVVLLTVPNAGDSKGKPDMIALELTTGNVRWESQFTDRVDLHAVEGAGHWGVKYDLSGYPPPAYDGDSIYLTYAGLHRYDLNTGKLIWKNTYDVTEGRIKRGNAPAIVEGNVVYTSAKGELRAHDKATGQVKWMTKGMGGAVAQVISKGDVLYCRMGGHFYDYHKSEWVLEKPLGVTALNKNTGTAIWRYDKAEDGITNMVLLPEQNTILIADSKNLIGLDTSGEGKMKENFKVKLEFKNKIGGGAKAARAGMKFAHGGLIGMAKKDHDEDAPVSITLRENGTAVVQAKQHLLAFNTKDKSIPWSVEYDAPGVPNWQKLVMFAITAASYGYQVSGAAHTQLGTDANNYFNQSKNDIMTAYQSFYFKRFSSTRTTGQFAYILTTVEDGDDKGSGIIGVSLDSGASNHQVLFKAKEPNYKVDDVTGRVFMMQKDGKELTAFAVK